MPPPEAFTTMRSGFGGGLPCAKAGRGKPAAAMPPAVRSRPRRFVRILSLAPPSVGSPLQHPAVPAFLRTCAVLGPPGEVHPELLREVCRRGRQQRADVLRHETDRLRAQPRI